MDRLTFLLGGLGLSLSDMAVIGQSTTKKSLDSNLASGISKVRFASTAKRIRDKYPRLANYIEALRVIPSGDFQMGGDATRHKVSLSSYGLGATPVTVGLWKEYATAKLSGQMPPEPDPWHFNVAKFNVGWQDLDHPIVCVSWADCRKFCIWASEVSGLQLDLPSEAQWEYACRGGLPSNEYPWGSEIDERITRRFFTANVWCSDSKAGDIGGTGSVNRSMRIWRNHPWGLTDMVGNVWEWCQDKYDPNWYGRPEASGLDVVNLNSPPAQTITLKDGTTIDGVRRCARGGSWIYEGLPFFRCDYRFSMGPIYRGDEFGFRLCAGPR